MELVLKGRRSVAIGIQMARIPTGWRLGSQGGGKLTPSRKASGGGSSRTEGPSRAG